MNLVSAQERERYFAAFKKEMVGKKFKEVEIILCPPDVHLESFAKNVKNKTVKIGAQDIFWETKGSFTGETSPMMIKNLGAEYAIIGHSERRRYFGETDESVNLKIKAALRNGIAPIFCLGETKEEKEMDMIMDVMVRQIQGGLEGVTSGNLEKIIFAYEPVWAVGTDLVPSANEIMGAKLLIRKILTEKYGSRSAMKAKIIYGGSVKDKFVKQVCLDPAMDGVLVGRESLIPREFLKIVQIIDNN